jgi:hypothetical protein
MPTPTPAAESDTPVPSSPPEELMRDTSHYVSGGVLREYPTLKSNIGLAERVILPLVY